MSSETRLGSKSSKDVSLDSDSGQDSEKLKRKHNLQMINPRVELIVSRSALSSRGVFGALKHVLGIKTPRTCLKSQDLVQEREKMVSESTYSYFVHDGNARFINLFLKLLHGRADIACRDYIDLFPNGGLDDESMVGVRDQADSNCYLLSDLVYTLCKPNSPSTLPISASKASESSTSNDMGLAPLTSWHRFCALPSVLQPVCHQSPLDFMRGAN